MNQSDIKTMKRRFLAIAATLAVLASMSAQELYYEEAEVFANEDVTFRQIDEHTWEGNGKLMFFESLYLIEGEERAILLDAGTVIKNLPEIVARITSKPVTLIATHVHPDHTGSAIHDFDEIYLNIADTVNMPEYMPDYKGTIKCLKDGEIIDLGGRKIEVMFTPGHTPGSVTFFDVEAGYGFSADAFGSGHLLLFTNFSDLLATSKKVDAYMTKNNIRYLYPGHYSGDNKESPQRIKDMIKICEQMLSGKRKGEPLKEPQMGLDMVVKAYGIDIKFSSSHGVE